MWLYYMRLKQRFFSSIFSRFSLMLTMYIKNIFLVVFVWFPWLSSKYKNSFFLLLPCFFKNYLANIRFRFEFRNSHQRCSIKKLFLEILQYAQENTCVGVSFFSVNIAKFQRTPILKNIYKRLLLRVTIYLL